MKTLANFLTQPNQDFPLDCETMAYIQELAELPSVIGNIAGDKVILSGCETVNNGLTRAEGYLFIRTKRRPLGEILWWEGGSTALGMYVRETDVSVEINNVSYPKAYTTRSLAPGIGEENYSWDDFTAIQTIKELMQSNTKLQQKLERMQPAPLGIVQMWAGTKVPEGYVLCNGQALRETDYPELRKALGTTFNTALSASGTAYTTQPGYFRVPDLRGRFVVGQHDSDNDYKTPGSGGGCKAVALTKEQLPSHSHEVKDYTMIPHGSGECTVGDWIVGGASYKVGHDSLSGNPKRCQTDNDKRDNIQWIKHPTEVVGEGVNHENRPPYYVLAYIMRAI